MPPCLRDVKRALEKQGGTAEPPNDGSHWKARLGGDCYPIPAHNGLKTQIADRWINGLCRRLTKLNEAKFRSDL